jgi:hypothetical protein
VTGSDLIVLAPWIVFGAAVGAICARLIAGRSRARRRRRAARRPDQPPPTSGDSADGTRAADSGGRPLNRVPSPGQPGAAS